MQVSDARAFLDSVPGLDLDGVQTDFAAELMAAYDGCILLGRVWGIVEGHGIVTPVAHVRQCLRNVDPAEIEGIVQALLAMGVVRGLAPGTVTDQCVYDCDGSPIAFLIKA